MPALKSETITHESLSMSYDVCVVGGGIVGLATALEVLRGKPKARVLVLEKEASVAVHQTGHNSGVIHAGIYYKPNSLKAELCRAGEAATKQFCLQHDIPFRTPGKLVVATDEIELERMQQLEVNARTNGIDVRQIDARELRKLEPNIAGLGALRVASTGIVSYVRVAQTMAQLIRDAGGDIVFGITVDDIRETERTVEIVSGQLCFTAERVVVCAGLQADRLARKSGLDVDFQIVPFRGEYYILRPEKADIVQHLIYPIPDPALPFLGIHLTPMIDGTITVGPNAVLGWSREGYPQFSFNPADVATYLAYPGFWKAMSRNLKAGAAELKDSLFKSSYLRKCQKYCPSLRAEDFAAFRAGIRAQAVSSSGQLIHDFHFLQSERVLHVGNAPSPAATSAIPIAKMIVTRLASPHLSSGSRTNHDA